MSLTIKNFAAELPKELIALAGKNMVRECDEIEKGKYVAYVDEGKDSYDVQLSILQNNEVGASSCDCKNANTFCRHKLALLIHISKGKKIKTGIKPRKKENQVEQLLAALDFAELQEWVRDLVEKNKDVELAFIHRFSAKQQQYTKEDVVKLTNDAIKAAGANKKNIDATQIKKLVELWGNVLAPVLQQYLDDVAEESSFQNVHAIIENCYIFYLRSSSTSNKIPRYIEDILQKVAAGINDLKNDETWYRATGYFIDLIPEGTNKIRMHYLNHVKNIISVADDKKREKIIDLLAQQFKYSLIDHIFNGPQYVKAFFGVIEAHNLFPKYFDLFRPLRFDNEYNQKLIGLLILGGHLDLAKEYCQEQINSNYKEEYSISYLKLLKEIYSIQQDEKGLVNVLNTLLPYTYNFDDFLYIYQRMAETERKVWRTKILSRASNASYNNKYARLFRFKLMDYDKNYLKMIDYIDSYTSFRSILEYFEPMALAYKKELLHAIIRKRDDYGFGSNSKESQNDVLCFPELFGKILHHYPADYLKLAVAEEERSNGSYSLNKFLIYMKEQLNK